MINGMFWNGNYTGIGEDHPQVNQPSRSPFRFTTRTAVANWIWTATSRLVNEARYGCDVVYFYQGVGDGNVLANGQGGLCSTNGTCGGKGYPLNTGVTACGGLPDITISPLVTLHRCVAKSSRRLPNPYYDLQDALSYLRGKHSLQVRRRVHAHPGLYRIWEHRAGQDRLPGRRDSRCGIIALPQPKHRRPTILPTRRLLRRKSDRRISPHRHNGSHATTRRLITGFVQDDWRIAQEIMLNLGLRYSYNIAVPRDQQPVR